ncbi:MAG: hypothetical protein EXS52_01405 [Candidatus Staskawiczbacteria bacterium]|nr:hypothetical protein [Candidatus Staskawiczbacteria bacterium]
MPKELHELVGEPLGFGEDKIVKADGSESLIEKALLLNDLCEKFKGRLAGRKILLCFSTMEKHGTGLTLLEVLDEEDAHKRRVLVSWSILAKEVKQETLLGKNFLAGMLRQYGIKKGEFLKLL